MFHGFLMDQDVTPSLTCVLRITWVETVVEAQESLWIWNKMNQKQFGQNVNIFASNAMWANRHDYFRFVHQTKIGPQLEFLLSAFESALKWSTAKGINEAVKNSAPSMCFSPFVFICIL